MLVWHKSYFLRNYFKFQKSETVFKKKFRTIKKTFLIEFLNLFLLCLILI